MIVPWDQFDMYIKGRLIENNAGARYKGIVYDRSLRIHESNGFELSIFDDSYPIEPISRHCQIGNHYEFVVMVMIGTATTVYDVPPNHDVDENTFSGIVVDPNWFPPEDPDAHFQYFNPRLYHNAGGFRLVKTKFGHILFGPDEIHSAARIGWHVEWHSTRFELLAFYHIENDRRPDSTVASYTS